MKRLLLVFVFLLAPGLRAESIVLDAPVSPGSTITYAQLVAVVFTGAHNDVVGWVTGPEKVLRRIGEKGRTTVPEGSPLGNVEALRIRGDGRTYVVLLIAVDFEGGVPGGGAAVLAAFPEGSAEPVDVADVKRDLWCSFAEKATLAIGADDAFIVTNSHNNSNQGYVDTSLFYIAGGRLRRIDSIFTLSVGGVCGASFDEALTWQTKDEAHDPHPRIVATVALTPVADGGDCPKSPRRHKQVFKAVYRFEDGRYVAAQSTMKVLDRFNRKHL